MRRLIQVCSECETALCAQGEMMCFESRGANLKLVSEESLAKKGAEHKSHFSEEKITMVYGDPVPFGYAAEAKGL
jgi:hypothetical protein